MQETVGNNGMYTPGPFRWKRQSVTLNKVSVPTRVAAVPGIFAPALVAAHGAHGQYRARAGDPVRVQADAGLESAYRCGQALVGLEEVVGDKARSAAHRFFQMAEFRSGLVDDVRSAGDPAVRDLAGRDLSAQAGPPLVDVARAARAGQPVGRRVDQGVVAAHDVGAAADAAFRPAKPMDNTDFTLAWRKEMVRVHVQRALQDIRGQIT